MPTKLLYFGTKLIEATPISRLAYNQFRGWELPDDENGDDLGYMVKYPDGYISWCPEKQFNEAYQPLTNLSFGHAIEAAKRGSRIARQGWNGKNMFVVLMPELNLPPYNTSDTHRKVNDRTAKYIGEDTPLYCQPYFAMYTAQKQWQPGWLASQSDMLANDWMVLDEEELGFNV